MTLGLPVADGAFKHDGPEHGEQGDKNREGCQDSWRVSPNHRVIDFTEHWLQAVEHDWNLAAANEDFLDISALVQVMGSVFCKAFCKH